MCVCVCVYHICIKEQTLANVVFHECKSSFNDLMFFTVGLRLLASISKV